MIIIGRRRATPIQARAKPNPQENEQTLLQRVARKDRTALAEVYTRFQRPLFAYLFHLLGHKEQAEDILQEVMLIVWQKAYTFKGNGSIASWIFGIAHHQAFKALRQPARVVLIEIEAASMIPDTAPEPEAHALHQANQEELTRALTCLTPEHREVLELAFFQDFSYKEIATIIGIPAGTVKSRISYARRALKAALLRNGWEI